MMHRDLKSPNVLLSEEGVAKIADVGMVRSQVKDLVTAQPVMTPLWAAPEVSWNLRQHLAFHVMRLSMHQKLYRCSLNGSQNVHLQSDTWDTMTTSLSSASQG